MKRCWLPLLLLAACASDDALPVRVPDKAKENVPEAVRRALLGADRVELLSVFPTPRERGGELWRQRGYGALPMIGDGYAVLGSTELEGKARARALEAFFRGVADSDGTVAECFDPRHALRARHEGRTVEALICYECLSMQFFRDGERLDGTTTTGAPGRTLTALLRDAGVTLPDR